MRTDRQTKREENGSFFQFLKEKCANNHLRINRNDSDLGLGTDILLAYICYVPPMCQRERAFVVIFVTKLFRPSPFVVIAA